MKRAALALLVAAATLGAGRLPDQGPALAVEVAGSEMRPALRLGSSLEDPALEEAVRSGLPLRLRFTLELWRDELFDDLVQHVEWTLVLQYEPLRNRFRVLGQDPDSIPEYASYQEARMALERPAIPSIRPPRSGRYYYLAALEVETLSLSDLEELENWLRGELQPAVQGGGSVSGAVGRGLKRILIRVLDLPVRRFAARSAKFDVGDTP
jgi:hypothetical protein